MRRDECGACRWFAAASRADRFGACVRNSADRRGRVMFDRVGRDRAACSVFAARREADGAVRCRDCAHWREVLMADGTRERRCDGMFMFVKPNPDGFCSWGREVENE